MPEPGSPSQPQDPRAVQEQAPDVSEVLEPFDIGTRDEFVETDFREQGGRPYETGGLFEEAFLAPVSPVWDKKYKERWLEADPETQDKYVFVWMYEQSGPEIYEYIKRVDLPEQLADMDKEGLTDTENLRKLRDHVVKMSREQRRRMLFEWLKDNQPENWNPEQPSRHTKSRERESAMTDLQAVQSEVYDLLEGRGVVDADVESPIRIYAAISTPVDTMYGVDAVLEADTAGGETVTCTLDLTTRPQKVASGPRADKADVVIDDIDLANAQNTRLLSKRIANVLLRRVTKPLQK